LHLRDIILPVDRGFYVLFEKMAGHIVSAAEEMGRITAGISSGSVGCQRIREIEHAGDEVTRGIYERLDQSLITPLEPEEISRLAPALDDILDRIDWAAQQLCNYGVTEQDDVLREFTRLIGLAAGEIQRGVGTLQTPGETRTPYDCATELNRLWNLGRDLLARATLDLFRSRDPIRILKMKDIYESLAIVLAKCNDFGHVVHDIALAHA
jgi:hypothetical protein